MELRSICSLDDKKTSYLKDSASKGLFQESFCLWLLSRHILGALDSGQITTFRVFRVPFMLSDGHGNKFSGCHKDSRECAEYPEGI